MELKFLRTKIKVIRGLVPLLMLLFVFQASAQREEQIKENKKFNERCFSCHKSSTYTYFNPEMEKNIRDKMCSDKVINPVEYYQSNHYSFRCTDCHSEDYDSFPHPGNLRMEGKYACIDCHGGDEAYEKYQFEKIEEEFLSSMHSAKHSEDFNCWMCHDPHTYKIAARSKEQIKDIIEYDNLICLSCHANVEKYNLITDGEKANILATHKWLPNQALHFKNVRCIECHTAVSNDILVAHMVQPKEDAVQNCVECHSANSHLMASLYKFRTIETRSNAGFMNGVILNDSFVIGANRNVLLNKASIAIFILSLIAILFHFVLRLITKK